MIIFLAHFTNVKFKLVAFAISDPTKYEMPHVISEIHEGFLLLLEKPCFWLADAFCQNIWSLCVNAMIPHCCDAFVREVGCRNILGIMDGDGAIALYVSCFIFIHML